MSLFNTGEHKEKKKIDFFNKKKKALEESPSLGLSGIQVPTFESDEYQTEPGVQGFGETFSPRITRAADLVKPNDGPNLKYFEQTEKPQQYTPEEQEKLEKKKKVMRVLEGVNLLGNLVANYSGGIVGGPITDGFWNRLEQEDQDYQNQLAAWNDENLRRQAYNMELANDAAFTRYNALQDRMNAQSERANELDDRNFDAELQKELDRMRYANQREADAREYDYKREYNQYLGGRNRIDSIDQLQEERNAVLSEMRNLTNSFGEITDQEKYNQLREQANQLNSIINDAALQLAGREGFDVSRPSPQPQSGGMQKFDAGDRMVVGDQEQAFDMTGKPMRSQNQGGSRNVNKGENMNKPGRDFTPEEVSQLTGSSEPGYSEAESVVNDILSEYKSESMSRKDAIFQLAPIFMRLNNMSKELALKAAEDYIDSN
jgi:hypothetical protein